MACLNSAKHLRCYKRCGRRGCSARTRPRHPAPSARTTRRRWCPHPAAAWRGAGRRSPGGSGSGAEPGGRGLATAALARRPAVRSSVGSGAELGGGGPAAAARRARARSRAKEARCGTGRRSSKKIRMGREWMTDESFIIVADGGKKTVLLVCRGK